ncbi:hypothetical protein HPB50_003153 [Hyalomma asiaticum]|uniref:Uncharacterized protein n=1 Tax=Hyalomma asiaticum TaxID=266040 RepID=A0ACB7TBK0_HYAAI|nr:hypothetical protein HPB50_003153 [Hyalomma asiaticum]
MRKATTLFLVKVVFAPNERESGGLPHQRRRDWKCRAWAVAAGDAAIRGEGVRAARYASRRRCGRAADGCVDGVTSSSSLPSFARVLEESEQRAAAFSRAEQFCELTPF